MPERDQDDHWDFLASDLGSEPGGDEQADEEEIESAEPKAELVDLEETLELDDVEETVEDLPEVIETEEAEDETPRPTEQSPRRGQSGDRVVSGFGYRRGSVDWANLARELGVEAMEEAPEPIPAADSVAPTRETVAFSVDETEAVEPEVFDVVEIVDEESEPVVEAPVKVLAEVPEPVFGGFGAGLLEDAAPTEAKTGDSVDGSEAKDEEQDERKGRRRRRRKPKKQKQEQETVETAEEVEVAEIEVAEAEKEEVTEKDEGRSRRKGRRRGGRKRRPREERSEPEPVVEGFGAGLAESDEEPHELSDAEFFDDEEAGEVEATGPKRKRRRSGSEDQNDEKTPSKKVSHRGIPNWSEAIGYVIDSNMEGRSKKPESGGSRQRGGRHRGGDRSGNRGRS